jgi:hypothetical protein
MTGQAADQEDDIQESVEDEQESTVLEMSDEDFAALDPEQLALPPEEVDDLEEGEEEDDPADPDDDARDEQDVDPDADPDKTDTDEADPDKQEADKDKPDEKDEAEVDYKSEHEKALAPLRANGKDMQVGSIEDLRTLAQMGANYSKKMGVMKPQLKIIKMLEQTELLDEGKLSFLIDLHQMKPEAIKKLVADSKIEPMDLAKTDEDPEYKPSNHQVSDTALKLDSVLDEIRDTDHYNETLNIASSVWDDESKKIVSNQPEILKTINDHLASGIYGLISTEVERERALGRLGNVSDIEAYRVTGDRMDKAGAFNTEEIIPDVKDTPTPKPSPTKPSADELARRARRKAAGPTKPAGPKGNAVSEVSPLALSDEEHMAKHQSTLM